MHEESALLVDFERHTCRVFIDFVLLVLSVCAINFTDSWFFMDSKASRGNKCRNQFEITLEDESRLCKLSFWDRIMRKLLSKQEFEARLLEKIEKTKSITGSSQEIFIPLKTPESSKMIYWSNIFCDVNIYVLLCYLPNEHKLIICVRQYLKMFMRRIEKESTVEKFLEA